jgi:nucleoside-diphosphate-sugar epimerase
MRLLLTGGTGNVGRALVARLVRHGYEVRVIGRRAGVTIDGAEYAQCDVTDFDALRQQVKGQDAIIHLAAIPSPGSGTGSEIFRINCAGTFNVYEVAAAEGIKRIACASSINALGYNYGIKDFEIRYFPIDEDHLSFTTDAYSFSKQITEEIAAYFWRREGISSVCLRLPWVYEATEEKWSRLRERLARTQQALEELMGLPGAEREARVHQIVRKFEAIRAGRVLEKAPEERRRAGVDSADLDVEIIFWRSNFWASVNAEDSAQAFEKGVLADYAGSHPLYLNDSHNSVGVESELLARVFFPEVKARKQPLQGTESLVSIARARALLGFDPEHSLRQR